MSTVELHLRLSAHKYLEALNRINWRLSRTSPPIPPGALVRLNPNLLRRIA